MSDENNNTLSATLWERAVAIYRGMLRTDAERSQMERHFPLFLSHELHDGEFCISVKEQIQAENFTREYKSALENALRLAGLENAQVKFIAKGGSSSSGVFHYTPSAPAASANPQRAPLHTFSSTLPLNDNYTFENFVQGPSNSIAHATATAVAKNLAKANYNPLFIYGGSGLGKTHLMQAIGHYVLETRSNISVCYITAEVFMNKFVEAMANGAEAKAEFRKRYRNIDLLLIDDVQFIVGKELIQDEFFNTYNDLMAYKKQIVMTSDLPPRNLEGLEERLKTRFQQGIQVEIESPGYETRLAILKLKARSAGVEIPEEIFKYIVENIRSHVRALEGALSLVIMFINANPQIPVTIEIAEHLLKDLVEKEINIKRLTVEDILNAVCTHYRVTAKEIKSSDRPQPLATARQVVMFLSRKLTNLSTPIIAKELEKNHTTVLHGCQAIQKRMQTEPDLLKSVELITADLGRKPSELYD